MPQAPRLDRPLLTARFDAGTAQAVAGTDGLWLTYTGQTVQTWINGLAQNADIDLVIDLATLSAAADTIPALQEHFSPVGVWSQIAIDQAGVRMRLKLLDATDESKGLRMFDAARELRLAIAQGFPFQASIGGRPGPDGGYERITAPTVVNGRSLTPGTRPLYVLRGGVLHETSVVLFGADGDTGRIAASRSTQNHTPEAPMSDPTISQRRDQLATQLGEAHRAIIAAALIDGKTDAAIIADIGKAELSSRDTKIAALTTELAAEKAKSADLATQLAALKPAGGEAPPPAGGKAPETATGSAVPTTREQAILAARDADGKPLRGFAALAAARRQHPALFK